MEEKIIPNINENWLKIDLKLYDNILSLKFVVLMKLYYKWNTIL